MGEIIETNVPGDNGLPGNIQSSETNSDKEIGLVDIWMLVGKHKKVSVFIVALSLMAGFGVSLFQKPVYKSKAAFEIGFITNRDFIKELYENPRTLVERTKRLNKKISVNFKRGYERVLRLSARGKNPAAAKDRLDSVLQDLIERHKRHHDEYRKILIEQLDSVNAQIEELRAIKKTIENQTAGPAGKGGRPSVLLTVERSRAALELVQLQKSRAELKLILTPLNFQPSLILEGPTTPPDKISFKSYQTVLISMLLGIVAALYYVFLRESVLKKIKQRQRQ